MSGTGDLVDMAYDALEGCEDLLAYHERHGTASLLILTQFNPRVATESARMICDQYHLTQKTNVVEIGAGVGFLAIELAKRCRSVIAIESDPAWSWIFTRSLYRHKPPNLTWIFGTAESMVGTIMADAAVIFTRSGVKEMRALGEAFAPLVIMPLHEGGDEQGDFHPASPLAER